MKIKTEEDIKLLITNKIEESIHLDFKEGAALTNTQKCKYEVAKDVSAFANSDGGTIIYGIEEKDHVAHSIKPVDGNKITKEWLDQIINSNINQRISDVKITPIRLEDDLSRRIYVVEIPRSASAPHMTSNRKYYRRFNFESVHMEEYEIRDLYLRSNISDLIIDDIELKTGDTDRTVFRNEAITTQQDFIITFQIINIGKGLEQYYKLEIESNLKFHSRDRLDMQISSYLVREESGNNIYSIPNESPIFSNEKSTIVRTYFQVNKNDDFEEKLDETITCRLFFSNGMNEKKVKLKEVFKINKISLSDCFR